MKISPRTSSPSSSQDHQTDVTNNDNVSAITQATSSSPSSCSYTNHIALSVVSPYLDLAVKNSKEKERLQFNAAQLSHGSARYERDTTATLSLPILHNNNEVATGGMDYVKTPSITFPDIESNHCFSNNTRAVMATRIKDSICNSEPNITPESYTTPATADAYVNIASEDLPATNLGHGEDIFTDTTHQVTKLVATPGSASDDRCPDIPPLTKPTTPLVGVDTSALPTLRTEIGVNKQLRIKATANQLTAAQDPLPDVSPHPKPTTPLVVTAHTLPDPTAIAIALNQELALKAVTAYQKLHPKKSTPKTGPKITNMSNNSSNVTDVASVVDANTTPPGDDVITQPPTVALKIPKNKSKKPKKQSAAKPNNNEHTKPPKVSKNRTKVTIAKKKVALRATRGNRDLSNSVVSNEPIIVTKHKKEKKRPMNLMFPVSVLVIIQSTGINWSIFQKYHRENITMSIILCVPDISIW